jgi:hypothetical protein
MRTRAKSELGFRVADRWRVEEDDVVDWARLRYLATPCGVARTPPDGPAAVTSRQPWQLHHRSTAQAVPFLATAGALRSDARMGSLVRSIYAVK